MLFWNIFTYTDIILFILTGLTVLYLLVFATTSMFSRTKEIPKPRNLNRFIILIPAYKNKSVIQTVQSALGQTYPQRLFDITVISNHLDEMTNFHLAQNPITLLTPNYEEGSKIKSLQLAINNLPQFKIYDLAIILEAGNVVEPEFLEQMNAAYESAGTKAIQAHRLSMNRDTVSSRLSSIFEEINNSIFRRGHIAIGLSSAIASAGVAFDFEWFKLHIQKFKSSWDDKELEILLTRQHIYIDYFDDILVYDEKSRQAEDFNRQHGSWIIRQFHSILRNFHYLPLAIYNRHYDLVDKIIQWMLIPRMIMMMIIILMGFITPFIYMTAALKWWALFAIVLLVFALATPNYLVDDKWNSTFFKVPFVLFSNILNKFKWGRKISDLADLKK